MPLLLQMLKPDQSSKLLALRALLKDVERPETPIAKLRRLVKDAEGGEGSGVSTESVMTSDINTETYGGGGSKKKLKRHGDDYEVVGTYKSKDDLKVGDCVSVYDEELT